VIDHKSTALPNLQSKKFQKKRELTALSSLSVVNKNTMKTTSRNNTAGKEIETRQDPHTHKYPGSDFPSSTLSSNHSKKQLLETMPPLFSLYNQETWNNNGMFAMTSKMTFPFLQRTTTTLCDTSSTPPSLLEEREKFRQRRALFEKSNSDRFTPTMHPLASISSKTSTADASESDGTTDADAAAATESKFSCPACLYTGVATCVGLSAYFAHSAYEMQRVAHYQKEAFANSSVFMKHSPHIFMAVSVGCLGLGAYRWHLG
jgi:hypothetical protein